jgi:prepilin-type N-terminal cleavage/methylation domain-containing protein
MIRLRNISRNGFTIVELTMGLLVVSIILAALAGLALAMSNGWQATQTQDNLQIARRQTSTQIYRKVRSAKYIGVATPDNANSGGGSEMGKGAAVFFWMGETDPGKTMYAYQLAVMEHDMSSATLRLYQLPQTASGAMTEFKGCDIDDSGDVEKFKQLSGVTCQIIGRNISSATFKVLPVSNTRATQSLEFQINYKSGDQEQPEYGTATVRGPQAPAAS